MDIVFSEKNCRRSKEKLRRVKSVMEVWGSEFSPSRSIGKCSYLYKILLPESYEDFYEKYVEYAQDHPNKDIRYRGLTKDEIIELAERYKNMSEENSDIDFPLSDYVYDALCHIIVETYDGMEKEREAIDMLKLCGFNAESADYEYDSKYTVI